jgi:hypothetical protein
VYLFLLSVGMLLLGGLNHRVTLGAQARRSGKRSVSSRFNSMRRRKRRFETACSDFLFSMLLVETTMWAFDSKY